MEQKHKSFWKKYSEMLIDIWQDVIQIAVYNTGLSDQGNLVVILPEDSMEEIIKAHKIVKSIRKRHIDTPLIISPHYIEHSLDSFPLEFLNIQSDYENIYQSKDIIKDLKFDKHFVRLEMERELKSKELLIKMTVLNNFGYSKILKELITVSIESVEPILKGLLFLLDEKIPILRKELICRADQVTDFDVSSLLTAVDFASGLHRFRKKEELTTFFEQYTKQLQVLSDYIELFEIK